MQHFTGFIDLYVFVYFALEDLCIVPCKEIFFKEAGRINIRKTISLAISPQEACDLGIIHTGTCC
jgi:hypothetical protein